MKVDKGSRIVRGGSRGLSSSRSVNVNKDSSSSGTCGSSWLQLAAARVTVAAEVAEVAAAVAAVAAVAAAAAAVGNSSISSSS
jgi:hypothetical protein